MGAHHRLHRRGPVDRHDCRHRHHLRFYKESFDTIIKLIIGGYGTKVIYEAAMTPVTYLVVNGLKRAEGVDVYDRNTDFNPFSSADEAR